MQRHAGGDGTRPGKLDLEFLGDLHIEGGDVLLVEDIVDTGRSLLTIRQRLEELSPKSLTTVALLDKPDRREVEITADLVGFTVPDEFLVGYGLDYAQRYRDLPFVGILDRSVYEGEV